MSSRILSSFYSRKTNELYHSCNNLQYILYRGSPKNLRKHEPHNPHTMQCTQVKGCAARPCPFMKEKPERPAAGRPQGWSPEPRALGSQRRDKGSGPCSDRVELPAWRTASLAPHIAGDCASSGKVRACSLAGGSPSELGPAQLLLAGFVTHFLLPGLVHQLAAMSPVLSSFTEPFLASPWLARTPPKSFCEHSSASWPSQSRAALEFLAQVYTAKPQVDSRQSFTTRSGSQALISAPTHPS